MKAKSIAHFFDNRWCIYRVSKYRMPDMGQMNANLVTPKITQTQKWLIGAGWLYESYAKTGEQQNLPASERHELDVRYSEDIGT